MRAIIHRLRRLETAAIPLERERRIVEAILESRRRRLEASGQPYDEEPLHVDYTGCRTPADHITRSRAARLQRQLPRTEGATLGGGAER